MSIITELAKLQARIKAALRLFDELAAAIDREDNRAIGAAMQNLGRELRQARRLMEGGE